MARIGYGRSASGQIVRVADARRGVRYTCPTCGLLLELRRGEQLEYFAHWRNLPGSKDCELFSPGDSGQVADANAASRRSLVEVEEDPSQLGLLLAQVDGRWGVGLRLPEIPSDELGETSLSALRSTWVNVYAGQTILTRISALDLRPGVGAARVDVAPGLQSFRVEPAGSWPSAIDSERWSLSSRALEAKGNLFRIRRGEWTRLVARSGVHHGATLLVLGDDRFPPPATIVREEHARLTTGGLHWIIWEVQLPTEPNADVTSWLARLGHEFIPRPWTVDLATPPRAYGERNEPIFWVGDFALLTLEAPQRAATAMVSFQSGTNAHSASLTASESRVAHVGLKAHDTGRSQLAVAGERSARLDIEFVHRPSRAALLEQLARTPRLRLQIGQHTLEAWRRPEHQLEIPLRDQLDVHADLGVACARARVTVWDRGKQRTRRGLDARGVERAVAEVLATASRIEVDADNLGSVLVLLTRPALETPNEHRADDRLAWRDEIMSLSSPQEPHTIPALLHRPGSGSAVVRRVGPAALARSRLALRRCLGIGGSRQ